MAAAPPRASSAPPSGGSSSSTFAPVAWIIGFLRVWKQKRILNALGEDITAQAPKRHAHSAGTIFSAGLPWLTLSRPSDRRFGHLMASANSAGGVMGKMIDAQIVVVASAATQNYGQEGSILRFVFFHSLALACLVGVLVFLMAYVHPFPNLVVR